MSQGMHKTYFYLVLMMVPLAALLTRTLARLKPQVPLGYQDENGFHIGTNQSNNKASWPPFW